MTGGTGELGRVMVRTLARCGASVIVHYHRNRARADALVAEISGIGVKAFAVQADLLGKLNVAWWVTSFADLEVGNVIKYVCRYDAKNGVEDLRKAAAYLLMMIERANGNKNYVPGQEVPGTGPEVAGSPASGAVHRDGGKRPRRQPGVRAGSYSRKSPRR
ncbi:MAG: SDR family NAD(P)-dependent oxidoreductase, partial [bacterium]